MSLNQLVALAALRYRLSQNQQLKAGKLNLILTRLVLVILTVSSILAFVLPILLAPWLLDYIPERKLIAIWNGLVIFFLFSAGMNFFGQLQLNEIISIEKLLHLPVSLTGAFLINYLSSFLNMLMLIFAPAMTGFTIGIILAKGSKFFIFLPALLVVFFLTTSLLHQLRAIFARITTNKRNKSLVIVVLPFLMVIGVVGISFFSKAFKPSDVTTDITGEMIRNWVNWTPTWPTLLGLFAFGCASQYFSYRSLIKYYTGADSPKSGKNREQRDNLWRSEFLFRRLPFLSTGTSAVTTSGFRNIIRAPEALMALIPPVLALLLGIPYLAGLGNFGVSDLVRPWLQIGVVTVTMLGFPAFVFTTFSYDRDGFRAFVLSPLQRSEILLGKNMAIAIPTILSGIVLLAISQIFLPDHGIAFAAGLIQIVACYLAMCICGNFLSICFPIGLKRGNMQPANAPIIHTIAVYLGVLVVPFLVVQPAMTMIFVEMAFQGNFGVIRGWIYLPLSILQLVVTGLIYVWTLTPFGNWLWNRESRILEVVSKIPE